MFLMFIDVIDRLNFCDDVIKLRADEFPFLSWNIRLKMMAHHYSEHIFIS